MDPKKRHSKIRKFAIEMSRALKLESEGGWVLIWTDESYVNQNHIPGTTWIHEAKKVERPTGKGKRLVILHAISADDFVCEYMDSGMGIEEGRYGKDGTEMKERKTAEWIWPAKDAKGDYHAEMKGEGFEGWLKYRLVPAFEAKFPGKKMILIMDNASYHHEMNREYYPAGVTMSNATKAWHAHVLRKAGCSQIKVTRKNGNNTITKYFEVPNEEPEGFKLHRIKKKGEKVTAPSGAEEEYKDTVYERKKSNTGISTEELLTATKKWLQEHKPEALQSPVELLFEAKGWKIVWTPPYCPKFQPIELVWGAAKQRVSWAYFGRRTLKQTHEHLRIGFYGGTMNKEKNSEKTYEKINVAGCWRKAKGEINKWIKADREHVGESGLAGDLDNLQGANNWTASDAMCLDIKDYKGDLGEAVIEDPEVDEDDDDDDDAAGGA